MLPNTQYRALKVAGSLVGIAIAILVIAQVANWRPVQASPLSGTTVTCGSTTVTLDGTAADIAAVIAELANRGCSTSGAAPAATPVSSATVTTTVSAPAINTAGTCRVMTSANIRSGAGTSNSIVRTATAGERLVVLGVSAGWVNVEEGWISSSLCKLVPDTIETAPRECHAFLREDGFQMDTAVDAAGTQYDVTILNTAPVKEDGSKDLCWSYRVIQDGAGSSIINDRLPQPPGTRGDAPESVDFTFLAHDWEDVQIAYYTGIAGRLLIDHDKNPDTPLQAVLDLNGQPVQFSENGAQQFRPEIGGWYRWQCVNNCAMHWGFRVDHLPWTR